MKGTISMTNDGYGAAKRGSALYTDLHPCGCRPTMDRVYKALDLRRAFPGHPSSREMWNVQIVCDMKTRMEFEFTRRQR